MKYPVFGGSPKCAKKSINEIQSVLKTSKSTTELSAYGNQQGSIDSSPLKHSASAFKIPKLTLKRTKSKLKMMFPSQHISPFKIQEGSSKNPSVDASIEEQANYSELLKENPSEIQRIAEDCQITINESISTQQAQLYESSLDLEIIENRLVENKEKISSVENEHENRQQITMVNSIYSHNSISELVYIETHQDFHFSNSFSKIFIFIKAFSNCAPSLIAVFFSIILIVFAFLSAFYLSDSCQKSSAKLAYRIFLNLNILGIAISCIISGVESVVFLFDYNWRKNNKVTLKSCIISTVCTLDVVYLAVACINIGKFVLFLIFLAVYKKINGSLVETFGMQKYYQFLFNIISFLLLAIIPVIVGSVLLFQNKAQENNKTSSFENGF